MITNETQKSKHNSILRSFKAIYSLENVDLSMTTELHRSKLPNFINT